MSQKQIVLRKDLTTSFVAAHVCFLCHTFLREERKRREEKGRERKGGKGRKERKKIGGRRIEKMVGGSEKDEINNDS